MFDEVKIREFGNLEDLMDNNGNINIETSCGLLKFQSTDISYVSEDEYSWTGRYINYIDTTCAACSGMDFYIYRNEDGILGSFADYNHNYSLFGLGEDYVAFARLDTAFNSVCGTVAKESGPGNPIENPKGGLGLQELSPVTNDNFLAPYTNEASKELRNKNIQSRSGTICNVDVLVVSTTAANLISPVTVAGPAAIAEFNQIARNSDIDQCDLQLRLAGTAIFDYTSVSSLVDVNTTFPMSSQLTALRNSVNADIVIVLHDHLYENDPDGEIFGMVSVIPATNTVNSYAHVDINTAIGGVHVFSHEVSHLFGGRHNNDSTDEPARARNWLQCWKTRRTVTNRGAGTKIPHFSNPNVEYLGRKTGKKSRNNAEKLRGIGCTLGNIITVVEPFSIALTEQPVPCSCTNIGVSAQVLNSSNGAISYLWERSVDGVNWNSIGQAGLSSVNVIVPCDPGEAVFVRVTATDAASSVANANITVVSSGEIGEGCPQFIPSNPRENLLVSINQLNGNNFQLDFDNSLEPNDFMLDVVDGLGRVISSGMVNYSGEESVIVNLHYIPDFGVLVLRDMSGYVIQSKVILR